MANAEQIFNGFVTTLTADIAAGATSLALGAAGVSPAAGNYRLAIDSEIFKVTLRSGLTYTVVGAQEGTAEAEHLAGAAVVVGLATAAVMTNGFAALDGDGNIVGNLIIYNGTHNALASYVPVAGQPAFEFGASVGGVRTPDLFGVGDGTRTFVQCVHALANGIIQNSALIAPTPPQASLPGTTLDSHQYFHIFTGDTRSAMTGNFYVVRGNEASTATTYTNEFCVGSDCMTEDTGDPTTITGGLFSGLVINRLKIGLGLSIDERYNGGAASSNNFTTATCINFSSPHSFTRTTASFTANALTPALNVPIYNLGTLTDSTTYTINAPATTGQLARSGQEIEFHGVSSANGNAAITWNGTFKFGSAATAATVLSSTIMALHLGNFTVRFRYNSTLSAWVCTSIVYGY